MWKFLTPPPPPLPVGIVGIPPPSISITPPFPLSPRQMLSSNASG